MSFADTRLSWQPDTYAELGAAVPFTTPTLAGARARRGKRGMELTLPNPSGKRGIYILEAGELGRYCQATIHDRKLAQALHDQPVIAPGPVRHTARAVARDGFAGRQAAQAAREAGQADAQAALTMQLAIVRLLVRQTAGDDAAAREMPAKLAIEALAARSGHSFAAVRGAIETLARLAAPAGLTQAAGAAHARLLADMAALADTVEELSHKEGTREAAAASLARAVIRDTTAMAKRALARVWKFLDNLPAVLTACLNEPAAVAAAYDRLDWLLDGWTTPCLVLRRAPPGWICAAVNEIGLMVPQIPAEAGAWFGMETGEPARQAKRAEVLGFSDWRKDALALTLTARNETIRAMAA